MDTLSARAVVVVPPTLPPEAPLDMPVQSLRRASPAPGRPATEPRLVLARRGAVIGGAAALTGFAAWQMYHVLNVGGPTALGIAVLILFVLLFAWIALAFTSALAGFVSALAGGGLPLGIDPRAPLPTLSARTAILMPTYNEEPARIAAGLQAVHEELAALGRGDAFDFFILSDTTDPDIWIAEEAAFLALRDRLALATGIYYRHRPKNTERKAGNIAEWVRRFGSAYAHMLILDADSVMTGEALVRLAAAMEQHPRVGLIQTLPQIVNARTLFARLQQFAGRVYGPMVAHGIAAWHGAAGNYWGHNAIIRTRAFAEAAGLPTLAGPKPFGGAIMSHDFVEAALLRRAGWAVHMAPALAGSYEESPPSLTDVAVRDRRWAQGNLQHAAVLGARGLHPISRLHLLMGIGSYLTSPLWLLFLVTGVLISLQARFVRPDYFPDEQVLFPTWPQTDPVLAMWVFAGTMAVLLIPKLLGWIVFLTDRPARRAAGGAARSVLGLLLEILLTGLIAPITMVIQSEHVVSILRGHDSGWSAQRRSGGATFAEIRRAYARYSLLGLLLGAGVYAVSPSLLLWMAPVVLGLALAIPLVALTGRALGSRVLATPEDGAPPEVVRRARALYESLLPASAATEACDRLMRDPRLLALHRAALPPPRIPGVDPLDDALVLGLARLAEARDLDGAAALPRAEKIAVLGSAAGIDRLGDLAVQRRPDGSRSSASGSGAAFTVGAASD